MAETEQSAIDVIFEMRDLIKSQQQQIGLLQKTVSALDAKINENLFKTIIDAMPRIKPLGVEPAKAIAKELVPTKPAQEAKPAVQAPRQNIKVSGTLQDDSGKPLHSVEVKIMDANNRLVKQTKTNRSGQWMSFLPPGRYTSEFIAPGMQPDFRVFDLLAGQSEVDVS